MANPYFNAAYYLAANLDVLAAGYTVETAEQHYLNYGAAEALAGTNAARKPAPWFDIQYYLTSNPDLLANGIGADNAFWHFTTYGQFEQRSPANGLTVTDAKLKAYADANEDLRTAFDITDTANLTDAQKDALTSHFYQYGYSEDRPGSPFESDVNPGETFTLTTAPDNIVGTAGNDTVDGYVNFGGGTTVNAASTFTAADQIDGGAGVDTLNVTVENAAGGAVALPGATIKNIEVINARNISGQNLNIDANNVPGITEVYADRATSNVIITNLATGAAAGIKGNGVVTNGGISVGYKTAADAATLNIEGGTTAGAVAITSAPTSVTVNSSGAANTIGTVALGGAATALSVNAATNLTTGNITGFAGTAAKISIAGAAAKVSLGTIENTTVKTVDASGLTAGGVTATLNDNTAINVTGGKGNDVITTGAVLAGTGLVDAGDGKDTLIVAATGHITSAAGKLYKNFDVLQVNGGATVDLTHLASTNTVGAVIINQTAGATGVANMTAEQAANVTVKAAVTGTDITFGVKDATKAGQIDTVKLTLDDGATTKGSFVFDAPVLAGVEKLEIVANENFQVKALTAATAIDSLTVTGAGTATIATGAVDFAANSVFDFSGAEGKVIFDASGAQAGATAGGLTIKGSATAVNEIKDSAKADVITGGAKSDAVTYTGGADTVTLGGAGDSFNFNTVKGSTAIGTDGLTFTFAAGDSVIKAGAAGAFTAATAFDATVTDVITGFDSAAWAAGAGAKFTIDTDVSATGLKFGTALTFGTTTVDQAGDFFILDNQANEVSTAYVFQDTNSNGVIDASDMMIKLVGSAQATAAEFAVSSGNLVFTSA